MPLKILALNSGSSSQKASLYEIADHLPELPPAPIWEGRIEWNGGSTSATVKRGTQTESLQIEGSRTEAVKQLLATLWSGPGSAAEIGVVGHRVVHGGPDFELPVVITPGVRSAIRSVAEFAPLHTEAELEGMTVAAEVLPDVPQVAVFDTGFHRGMPPAAAVYPGPYEWFESGIRRYGFHGINHQYCAGRAAQLLRTNTLENSCSDGSRNRSLTVAAPIGAERVSKRLPDRLVTCHLGNGCSLAAVQAGRSIDTTMGFTPLDGLMMGTRSGAVDPGILTYLMRQGRLDGTEIDHVLNKQSGLLGISGVSGDMREITAAVRQGHERARLAFDIYVHRLRSCIGSMAAVLGGLDALVFTGGVGENSPEVRAGACATLEFLGVHLDLERNAHPVLDTDIAADDSPVRVLVIRAQEDWAIAAECWKLIHVSEEVTA